MHFIFALVFCFINANAIEGVSDNSISNITDIIFTALLSNTTSDKIVELKTKLDLINKYTLDADNLAKLIINITKESKLTNTNFYDALSENDHFRSMSNDSRNLYLKLKAKLNRDDVLGILSEKGNVNAILNNARRMGEQYIGTNEDVVNDVVDKMIAESVVDNHKFDAEVNQSSYWDPQGELNDLQEHHQHDGRRIFKGERTTIRNYPFMVSVHVMGRFWCGGVIYWYDLVLTSAACLQLMHNNRFFRENPKVLAIRVGSNHSRIGGEKIDALEVYFHPSYNPKTLSNNIAVIRLRRLLRFTYHRTPKMIDISHDPMVPATTAEVLLLGWGVTKTSQKMAYEPIFLQRKFLPIYPNYFCKEIYGDKFITQTMFCAGTMTTGEGACDHDAGGPAILDGKLVGIISFGPSFCGFPNAPTVFTLVGAFADWIETVNESMPGYYRGKARTTTSTKNPLIDFFNTWGDEKMSRTEATLPIQPYDPIYSTPPLELPTEPETVLETETEPETETPPTVPGLRKHETYEDWSIGS